MKLRTFFYEILDWHTNKRRAGNHSTLNKRKMEVSGRKPWKQKGTGRARAGGADSPIWVGGAVAHGPQPKSYQYSIPKKKLRLARKIAIKEAIDHELLKVVELPQLDKPSTKQLSNWLTEVGITEGENVLILGCEDELTQTLALSVRNLRNVSLVKVENLSAVNFFNKDRVLATSKALEYSNQAYLS
ncbi:MAG: 50S ribosomal protein L4 [Deltaproteobacteria bacterium]|nr:50S ribosomal protein L4 [Deltaproteobacteria bacterium]